MKLILAQIVFILFTTFMVGDVIRVVVKYSKSIKTSSVYDTEKDENNTEEGANELEKETKEKEVKEPLIANYFDSSLNKQTIEANVVKYLSSQSNHVLSGFSTDILMPPELI